MFVFHIVFRRVPCRCLVNIGHKRRDHRGRFSHQYRSVLHFCSASYLSGSAPWHMCLKVIQSDSNGKLIFAILNSQIGDRWRFSLFRLEAFFKPPFIWKHLHLFTVDRSLQCILQLEIYSVKSAILWNTVGLHLSFNNLTFWTRRGTPSWNFSPICSAGKAANSKCCWFEACVVALP